MGVRKTKDFRTAQVFGDKDQGELFWGCRQMQEKL